jgi:hypothetical protein
MSDSCNSASTTGRALQRKVKKGAKYDFEFVKVASRLVAAGMSAKEVGFVLGVKPATIQQWKTRYEEFRLACGEGSEAKEIAKQHLVANGLRAAMGYDYEEVDRVLERGDDGEMVVKKETVKLKHRPVDKELLIFFLINLAKGSGEWTNTKSIEIQEKKANVNVNLTGEIESDVIRKLAGAALEQADAVEKRSKIVESKVVAD